MKTTTKYLRFRGQLYRSGAPLRLVTREENAEAARGEAQQALDNALYDQQELRKKFHDGLAHQRRLTAELLALTTEVGDAQKAYYAANDDVKYYQEVLEKLDQQDWNWLRQQSWLK
jgi:hypothetical protein